MSIKWLLQIRIYFIFFIVRMLSHAFFPLASSISSEVVRVDDDAPFSPSLINSAIFLISSSMHVNTFAVNYRGHHFMQSLIENKPLLLCLSIVSGITLLAAAQLSPDITAMLELVPFTPDVPLFFPFPNFCTNMNLFSAVPK